MASLFRSASLMPAKALIHLEVTCWSGWNGESLETSSVKIWTEERSILSPVTTGHATSSDPENCLCFFELEIDRIVNDVVVFAHRGLVVRNHDDSVNLTGLSTDKFILRLGATKKLATPTMDGGFGVRVTVSEIP